MALELFEALEQEQLAAALISELAGESPQRGVFEPACVVVQNAGLGRWLRLWQARQCGISAAVDMPFARSFISGALAEVGLLDRDQIIEGTGLTWRLFQLLAERIFEGWGAAGEPLRAYLGADHPNLERRCWQLAAQLSDLFDQYSIYRPQWLQWWLRGENKLPSALHWDWQARLLRAVMERIQLDPESFERRIFGLALQNFCEGRGTLAPSQAVLHVFGISSFSPAFLRFFLRLAETRVVKIYHLVCSEAFLGDLPRSFREAMLQEDYLLADGTGMAGMVDNPILVASGQATARFQSLLLALDYPIGDMPDRAQFAVDTDLLALQRSLRQNLGATSFRADGTVSLHSCHSRKREVQVLQQQLLSLFASHPDLRPEEIMVLAPEISDYADAIEAVFGEGVAAKVGGPPVTIPYCIADQRRDVEESCWRFLLCLIELMKGRQPFSQVASLLDFEPVCDRLNVGREELQELLELLQQAGIRWGIDAETRSQQGQPAFEAYSWEFGLKRLFDGLIFPEVVREGRAPIALGNRIAEVIGNLTQLLRPVFRMVRERQRKRTFREWADEFILLLRSVLGDSGGMHWMRYLAIMVGHLKEASTDVPIAFDTFCLILSGSREEASGPSGLLRRGITFCRLQPVRHIPAKVICILGMNEGDYPRQDRRAEFDLIDLQRVQAPHWKGGPLKLSEIQYLGDHRLREEDRQLFLDCVLNARQHLYISYVGQSDKSNEAIPPSLLVSELLQFLRRAPAGDDPDDGDRSRKLAKIHLRHPLQDWSLRNHRERQPTRGEPPVLIHFEPVVRTRGDEPGSSPGFLDDAEALRTDFGFDLPQQVGPGELRAFLTDPAKYYLKRRLKVDLTQLEWMNIHQDWEDLEVDTLEASHLRMRVFDEWTHRPPEGGDSRHFPEILREKLQTELVLPPGLAGDTIWNTVAEPVLRCLETHLQGVQLKRDRVEIKIDDISVSSEGWVLDEHRKLIVLRGALEGRHLLDACLRHAVSGAASLIVCLKDATCFEVEASGDMDTIRAWLARVIAAWKDGLRRPAPFSLAIGMEYVAALMKAEGSSAPADADDLLTKAYEAHWQNAWAMGDDSPAQRLCFDGDSPAAPGSPYRESFLVLAETLLRPVMEWKNSVVEGGQS